MRVLKLPGRDRGPCVGRIFEAYSLRRPSVIPPQWRKDRGPSVTRSPGTWVTRGRPSNGPGPWSRGPEPEPYGHTVSAFAMCSETGVE